MEVAEDRRDDEAQAAPPLPELLQAADDAVVAEGLDLGARLDVAGIDAGVLPLRQAADDAQIEIAADLPGDFGRGDDRRPVGRVGESAGGQRPLGRPSDAAAVEEIGVLPADGPGDVRPAGPEIEDAGPLDEKGPLLLVVSFLVGDVDDGRIDLDLAEVGIDREVEGQVAAEAAEEVEPRARVDSAPAAVGVAGLLGREGCLGEGERRDLEATAGRDAGEPREIGEARDKPALLLGHPGEMGLLVLAFDDPLELDAPDIDVAPLEPDLVEGDADLDRPAGLVDPGGALPDAVPGLVDLLVVGDRAVLDRAGGVDPEVIAAPAVVIGVDPDIEPIRSISSSRRPRRPTILAGSESERRAAK